MEEALQVDLMALPSLGGGLSDASGGLLRPDPAPLPLLPQLPPAVDPEPPQRGKVLPLPLRHLELVLNVCPLQQLLPEPLLLALAAPLPANSLQLRLQEVPLFLEGGCILVRLAKRFVHLLDPLVHLLARLIVPLLGEEQVRELKRPKRGVQVQVQALGVPHRPSHHAQQVLPRAEGSVLAFGLGLGLLLALLPEGLRVGPQQQRPHQGAVAMEDVLRLQAVEGAHVLDGGKELGVRGEVLGRCLVQVPPHEG